jgi:2-polyprenyl-3-methyl-5-hydroxy-6-metoxy-1,4-benzoquinol methylase
MISSAVTVAAALAFDSIAKTYDSIFTDSVVGRSQRTAVWKKAVSIFPSGGRILELNCGTGEDALFLARNGFTITACDASPRMIEVARTRKALEAPDAQIEFGVLCTENLDQLRSTQQFDGVFSNFSGLNCVADLSAVATDLLGHLHAGAPLLLCFSTRFCAWETLHYLSHAKFLKAFRRYRGYTHARMDDHTIPVFYPTLDSIRKSFGPQFRLRSVTGIGIVVPPSYMESWARQHRATFRLCEKLERVLNHVPGLRVLGDHMLVHLERV